jgi:hypothetical protein
MMPAHEAEVQEALDEGVQFRWLSTIKQASDSQIQIEKMELDATGFPQPTGKFETIAADCVVLALGQEANYKFLEGLSGLQFADGTLQVNQSNDDRSSRRLQRAVTWFPPNALSLWPPVTARKRRYSRTTLHFLGSQFRSLRSSSASLGRGVSGRGASERQWRHGSHKLKRLGAPKGLAAPKQRRWRPARGLTLGGETRLAYARGSEEPASR